MQKKIKFENIEILRNLIRNFSITSKSLRRKIIKLLIISMLSAAFESITLMTLFLFISYYTNAQISNNFFIDLIQDNLNDKSYLGSLLIISLTIITFLKVYINKLQNKLAALMGAEIGEQYMSKVIEEGIKNTTKENYDQIISVLATDIPNVTTVYSALFGVLVAILSAFTISVTLFSISGIKTLVTLISIGTFYILSFKIINKELRQNGKRFIYFSQKAISITRSILENLRIILLDNKKILFKNYFVENYKKSKLIDAYIATSYQSPKYVVEGLVYISIISIIILVEYNYINFINLSELISIAYGILRLVQPTQMSFNFLSNLVAVSTQLQRINSKLFVKSNSISLRQEKINNSNQINFESEDINYSLKNISHKFQNSNNYILKNINLDFYNGQKICITGKSGSGKSTLADILCGLLLPTKGKININGIDLIENNKDRDKWKQRISYIPQNFTMISDKIIENIIFDDEDNNLDLKRIKACLEVAQIKDLLDFNNKEINQIANKLSGGQKQRINIARGIYKKANLYIFDEITSSLDVITKRKVISSIFNFLNEKTIFFITHDLSYLKLFDKVVFLDNGKIEIEGSYDYVIQNSTKFREYFKQNNNYKGKN